MSQLWSILGPLIGAAFFVLLVSSCLLIGGTP